MYRSSAAQNGNDGWPQERIPPELIALGNGLNVLGLDKL